MAGEGKAQSQLREPDQHEGQTGQPGRATVEGDFAKEILTDLRPRDGLHVAGEQGSEPVPQEESRKRRRDQDAQRRVQPGRESFVSGKQGGARHVPRQSNFPTSYRRGGVRELHPTEHR